MFKPTHWLSVLALGLGAAVAANAQPNPKERRIPLIVEIVKLADTLEQGNVSARAKWIVQEFDPCDMPQIFRDGHRGGAGIGSAAQAGFKNSIEDLVRKWADKKPPTQEQLDAHQMDLVRMSRVLQVMAELAPHRVHIYVNKNDEKRTAEWFKVATDFKTVTRELRDALEQADLAKTRKAAVKLGQTCNACHKVAGV